VTGKGRISIKQKATESIYLTTFRLLLARAAGAFCPGQLISFPEEANACLDAIHCALESVILTEAETASSFAQEAGHRFESLSFCAAK
jgi:hypothetical protein